MAKHVMFWDCDWCKTKKIPGYDRICPGCGHPRSRKVDFYHSNPPTEATAKQAALFGKPDPNWYCEGCDSGNLQEDNKCWRCGTARTAQSPVGIKRKGYKKGKLAFSAEEARKIDPEMEVVSTAAWEPTNEWEGPDSVQSSKKKVDQPSSFLSQFTQKEDDDQYDTLGIDTYNLKRIGFTLAVVAVVLTTIIFLYNFFFNTHTETVQVQSMYWTQNVNIEEYITYHEEGWSVPSEVYGQNSAGRVTNSETRKSGERKVHDGWTTEQVPDTCYRTETVPDTCTGYRDVPSTCTGSEYVSDTCYTNNGDGSSDSYECGGYETYTYSCTESESYTYACTTTEQVPYACTKTVDVELYHYEDVFSTWYWYDIERWTVVASYPTSGYDQFPYFDATQPNNLQRRIEQLGTYTVTFGSEEIDSFTVEYDAETFKTYFVGQEHQITVNFMNTVLSTP